MMVVIGSNYQHSHLRVHSMIAVLSIRYKQVPLLMIPFW